MVLEFVRFVNQVNKTEFKKVGFSITGTKKEIFKIMMKSITDFTIPQSYCTIFYQNMNGGILGKRFKRIFGKHYYVNGDVNTNNLGIS